MARVVLTGSDLTLDDVLAVARGGARVEIDPAALAAMAAARAVVDRSIADGSAGLRRHDRGRQPQGCSTSTTTDHDRLLVRQHRISQGAPVAHEVVRGDRAPARERARAGDDRGPARARRASRRGAERRPAAGDPRARLDRTERPRADGRPRGRRPRRLRARPAARRSRCSTRARSRPATARSRSPTRSCCSTCSTTPARSTSRRSARTANSVHPAIGVARPYPGLQVDARPPRRAARGQRGRGARPAGPAHVPDDRPAERRRPGRLRASSARSSRSSSTRRSRTRSSLVDEGRVISVGNFEMQPLATALDVARLALAPAISTAAERAVKLLQRHLTGLTEGLGARPAHGRERAQRVRDRDPGDRRRGAAARPARSRSTSSRRPRPRGSRTG